jgi:hypothetical protein
MSSYAVRQAFRTVLESEYTDYPLYDLENEQFTPPVDTYGRVTPFLGLFAQGFEEQLGVGDPDNRCWREIGSVNVAIYFPTGRGIAGPNQIADAIRSVLRGRELPVTSPGIRLLVTDASPMGVLLPQYDKTIGNYLVMAVTAGYIFDFHS